MDAFCLASGPSLTEDDVERVRRWRSEDYRRIVVVTNLTYRLAPWADALFAFDARWLAEYMPEAKATFLGKIYSASGLAGRYGANWFPKAGFVNSGACAVSLAISQGARRVYLLGYDCQKTDGKTHWHDDYPKVGPRSRMKFGSAQSIGMWPDDFGRLAAYAHKKRVEVFNCSRVTALTVFPRVSLEAVA